MLACPRTAAFYSLISLVRIPERITHFCLVLQRAGTPKTIQNFLRNMYEESGTSIGRARGTREKFAMMTGVRQECLASRFLFTMAFDAVYRWLMTDSFSLEPDKPWFLQRVACAYADDCPLAVGFLSGALPIAAEAFQEIDEVKGMG